MIYDRTQADVTNAEQIRKEKVQNFQALTESEITTLNRGMLTVDTINRIEEKQAELTGLLNAAGYWNTPTVSKIWTGEDWFYKEDLQRILNNENILREAFFVYVTTPQTPPVALDYEKLNAIEKILYDLETMITEMTSMYNECGDYECGE